MGIQLDLPGKQHRLLPLRPVLRVSPPKHLVGAPNIHSLGSRDPNGQDYSQGYSQLCSRPSHERQASQFRGHLPTATHGENHFRTIDSSSSGIDETARVPLYPLFSFDRTHLTLEKASRGDCLRAMLVPQWSAIVCVADTRPFAL